MVTLLKIIGCAILMSITFALSKLLTGVYCFVEKAVDWIVSPYESLISHIAWYVNKIKYRITKTSEDEDVGEWGTKGSVIFIVLISIVTVVLFVVKYFTITDLQDFFEFEIILNTPGLCFFGWIVSLANGSNPFSFGNIIEMTLISFVQIAFYRKINDDVDGFPKFIYNMIFYLFSMSVAFVLPADVFELPLVILREFPTVFDWVTGSPLYEQFLPRLFLAYFLFQYIKFNIFLLHLLLSCIAIAVRESCATLIYSLPSFGIFAILGMLFTDYFNAHRNVENIVLVAFAVVSVVLTEIWREHCVEEY